MQQYDTPEMLRSFLKLCLDPGPGREKRTPVRLAEVLPEPLARKVAEFSPHVGRLWHSAKAVDERAKAAHRAYADALAAWIHGDESQPAAVLLSSRCDACEHALNWHTNKGGCTVTLCVCGRFQAPTEQGAEDVDERYLIGWNGISVTLYDRHEKRLVVDNATWAHCRRVRDQLLAAGEPKPCKKCGAPPASHVAWASGHLYVALDEPKAAPRRSMPLLEAVTAAYDATVSHAVQCSTCWPGMRFAEMCAEGQRAALASLEPSAEPECAHITWEVTSEYRTANGMWVKSRKCADCGDQLPSSHELEPHWPEKAAQHPARD
ncbi:hypothetical protein ACWEQC_21850 [Streptomyces shenzhenensis]